MKVTQAAINRLKDQSNRKRNKKRLKDSGITLDTILSACAAHLHQVVEDVKGTSRKGGLVQVRHLYCWLAVHHTGYNLPEISALINREQTAVIWALKAINSEIEAGTPEVCEHLLTLQNTLLNQSL